MSVDVDSILMAACKLRETNEQEVRRCFRPEDWFVRTFAVSTVQ